MAPNASKDRCPREHSYDAENTYYRPGGGRGCKTCRRTQARDFQRRKRLERQNTSRPPAVREHQPEAWIGPREVQP
jgi:hypothetical protein